MSPKKRIKNFLLDLRSCCFQSADPLTNPQSLWATFWRGSWTLCNPAAADAAHSCAKWSKQTKRAAKNPLTKEGLQIFRGPDMQRLVQRDCQGGGGDAEIGAWETEWFGMEAAWVFPQQTSFCGRDLIIRFGSGEICALCTLIWETS